MGKTLSSDRPTDSGFDVLDLTNLLKKSNSQFYQEVTDYIEVYFRQSQFGHEWTRPFLPGRTKSKDWGIFQTEDFL
jgi:hypothetical protein